MSVSKDGFEHRVNPSFNIQRTKSPVPSCSPSGYVISMQNMQLKTEKGTSEGPPLQQNAPTAGPSHTKFASLSFHMTDRIRFLQFSQFELLAIRSVIEKNRVFGIQDEGRYGISFEYKLRLNPWEGQCSEAIHARLLVRGILAYLFSVGWILTASTNISKIKPSDKDADKDTLIFRKQARPPPPSIWMAISFNKENRLRLIGAPPDLIAGFQCLLKSMNLLQNEFWKEKRSNAYEFQISGYPWRPDGKESMSTRQLILNMMELLESFGWSLYATINQNNGHHNNSSGKKCSFCSSQYKNSSGTDNTNTQSSSTDSWYCVKAVDWVPGREVFHR